LRRFAFTASGLLPLCAVPSIPEASPNSPMLR
jgi:hypothetical protein